MHGGTKGSEQPWRLLCARAGDGADTPATSAAGGRISSEFAFPDSMATAAT